MASHIYRPFTFFTAKPLPMLKINLTVKLALFGFFVLLGFCFARSLHVGSVMGTILASVSLIAAVYFVYLMNEYRTTDSNGE